MPNTLVAQAKIKARKFFTRKQRTIQVTVRVTPTHDDATLREVSDLVRDLLAESCNCEESDTFKDVRLINACEEYVIETTGK